MGRIIVNRQLWRIPFEPVTSVPAAVPVGYLSLKGLSKVSGRLKTCFQTA